MSTHPNTILMLVLTPDDLPRKTAREILGSDYSRDEGNELQIGGRDYHCLLMENENYDEGFQIAAKQGELVFFIYVTYGYGDTVAFDEVSTHRDRLAAWAIENAVKHHCRWRIELTANYW